MDRVYTENLWERPKWKLNAFASEYVWHLGVVAGNRLKSMHNAMVQDLDNIYNIIKLKNMLHVNPLPKSFFWRKEIPKDDILIHCLYIPRYVYNKIIFSKITCDLQSACHDWFCLERDFYHTFENYMENKWYYDKDDEFGIYFTASQYVLDLDFSVESFFPKHRLFFHNTKPSLAEGEDFAIYNGIMESLYEQYNSFIKHASDSLELSEMCIKTNTWLVDCYIDSDGFLNYGFFLRLPINELKIRKEISVYGKQSKDIDFGDERLMKSFVTYVNTHLVQTLNLTDTKELRGNFTFADNDSYFTIIVPSVDIPDDTIKKLNITSCEANGSTKRLRIHMKYNREHFSGA